MQLSNPDDCIIHALNGRLKRLLKLRALIAGISYRRNLVFNLFDYSIRSEARVREHMRRPYKQGNGGLGKMTNS
jgi:hypothetical protein